MSLQGSTRACALAWSNPVAWWWGFLTLVSGVNVTVWFSLYGQLSERPAQSISRMSSIEVMLLLSAA